MEAESGAKIAIRGKGSVKEGKGRSDAAMNSNLEEDLHCLIMADSEEKVFPPPKPVPHPFCELYSNEQVAKAIAAIERIIETAASIPEGQNELKKNQLRMLATLNGTLRDDEGQTCQNCMSPPFLYPFSFPFLQVKI
jgi:splicing factor 1